MPADCGQPDTQALRAALLIQYHVSIELHLSINHNSYISAVLQKLHDLLPLTCQLRPARGCLGVLFETTKLVTFKPRAIWTGSSGELENCVSLV